MTKNKSAFSRFLELLKSLFIGGLLALLPLALTLTFFAFVYRTIKNWFSPIYHILPIWLKAVPMSEFLVVIVAIIAVGAVLRFFLLRPLIEFIEKIFGKLPLVRQVYFGIKQLLNAFSPRDNQHFQKVVLVEFPRRGTYSLGFLTNQVPSELIPESESGEPVVYYNVFVPHTPNPTTGFFMLIPAHECHVTPLTRQEAMTTIISGGIIQPERFTKKSE